MCNIIVVHELHDMLRTKKKKHKQPFGLGIHGPKKQGNRRTLGGLMVVFGPISMARRKKRIVLGLLWYTAQSKRKKNM